jgi:hypothetical protein
LPCHLSSYNRISEPSLMEKVPRQKKYFFVAINPAQKCKPPGFQRTCDNIFEPPYFLFRIVCQVSFLVSSLNIYLLSRSIFFDLKVVNTKLALVFRGTSYLCSASCFDLQQHHMSYGWGYVRSNRANMNACSMYERSGGRWASTIQFRSTMQFMYTHNRLAVSLCGCICFRDRKIQY